MKTKRIMTFGSFEYLHAGHVFFFKEAKKLGGELVVGIFNDEMFRRLFKRKPIIEFVYRKEVIKALRDVDRVIEIKNNPVTYLRAVRPDLVVACSTVGVKYATSLGCSSKLHIIPCLEEFTSEALLNKLNILMKGLSNETANLY